MKLRLVAAGLVLALLAAAAMGIGRNSDETNAPPRTTPDHAKPKEGAVRAAADFLRAMDLETVLDDRARRRVIRAYAAPEDIERLDGIYAAERTRVVKSYRRTPRFARAALAGYRVDAITSEAATVAVWAAAIGGSRSYEPASAWSTSVVTLRRSDDRWTVRDVEHETGPSVDWPIRLLAAEGSRFKEFHVAP